MACLSSFSFVEVASGLDFRTFGRRHFDFDFQFHFHFHLLFPLPYRHFGSGGGNPRPFTEGPGSLGKDLDSEPDQAVAIYDSDEESSLSDISSRDGRAADGQQYDNARLVESIEFDESPKTRALPATVKTSSNSDDKWRLLRLIDKIAMAPPRQGTPRDRHSERTHYDAFRMNGLGPEGPQLEDLLLVSIRTGSTYLSYRYQRQGPHTHHSRTPAPFDIDRGAALRHQLDAVVNEAKVLDCQQWLTLLQQSVLPNARREHRGQGTSKVPPTWSDPATV